VVFAPPSPLGVVDLPFLYLIFVVVEAQSSDLG
jgi:hypothetical protein